MKSASSRKSVAWLEDDSDKDEISLLANQAQQYTQNTSIHGLVYLGEDGRSYIERIFWLLFIIGSFVLMVLFMTPIVDKFNDSPTIISPKTTNYPIWNIYFPAVTICSNNKLMKDQFRKVLKQSPWKNLSEAADDKKIFEKDLESAIKTTLLYETRPDLLKNETLNATTEMLLNNYKKQVPRLLQKVMHTCDNMLLLCIWEGKEVNCKDIFEIRRTDNGYCCSFNTIKMAEQFVSPTEINTDLGEGVDDTVDDYYGYDDYDDYDDDGDYYYYYDYETTTTETGNTDQETSTDTTTGDQETSTDTDQATTTGYSMSSTDSNGNTKRRKKRESTSQRSKTHRRRASAPVKKNTKDGLRTTTAANSLLGLSVVLYANQFQYSDVVMNNYYGFKVLVHSPYDFPGVGAKGFAVGETKEVFVAVGATATTTTTDVRNMPLTKRECLKHDENMDAYDDIVLQVFANYSQKACYLECEARALNSECGCLPYYFPDFSRVLKTDTACNVTGLRCLANFYSNAKKLKPSKNSQLPGTYCNCPVECESTIYSQEVSQAVRMIQSDTSFSPTIEKMTQKTLALGKLQAKIDNATAEGKGGKVQKLKKIRDDVIDSASIVHFYFKERGIVQYSREQLYTIMDVIAAFGGIIGLCMGFSLLSGVEIIYWFSLRILMDQIRKKKK